MGLVVALRDAYYEGSLRRKARDEKRPIYLEVACDTATVLRNVESSCQCSINVRAQQ